MPRKGCGRGRGWLKLEENSERLKPGLEVQKSNPPNIHVQQEKNIYENLIKQFEFLDLTDDGILLNQKLKHIREVFMKLCNSEEEITEAVIIIYQKCLKEEYFIEKFVLFITSAFFLNTQKSEAQNSWRSTIRKTFFNKLQSYYEKRDALRKETPGIFYNSLRLYIRFFHHIRKMNGHGYPFVETEAIKGYLNTLLDFGESIDIKMFANLVCGNQSILTKLCVEYQEMVPILNKIKMEIVRDGKIPQNQKYLLLFTYELLKNNFNISPEELLFYKNNFDKDDLNEILFKYGYVETELDMRKHNKTSLEECEPNEHPAFMDKSLSSSSNGEAINNPQLLHNNNSTEETKISNAFNNCNLGTEFNSYTVDKPFSAKHVGWKTNGENKSSEVKESIGGNDLEKKEEKLGRPILGVGARLKQRDSFEEWK